MDYPIWDEALASELTRSEQRLLPLLATPLSFGEIARLLEVPRDDVLAQAKSIYAKLDLSADGRHRLTEL